MLGKCFDICAGQAQTWHSADGYIWGIQTAGTQPAHSRHTAGTALITSNPIYWNQFYSGLMTWPPADTCWDQNWWQVICREKYLFMRAVAALRCIEDRQHHSLQQYWNIYWKQGFLAGSEAPIAVWLACDCIAVIASHSESARLYSFDRPCCWRGFHLLKETCLVLTWNSTPSNRTRLWHLLSTTGFLQICPHRNPRNQPNYRYKPLGSFFAGKIPTTQGGSSSRQLDEQNCSWCR